MGVVYRAIGPQGRPVAVKSVLASGPPEILRDALEVEAQALARLNHRGIVALLGYGVAAGHDVLATYPPGCSR